MRSSLVLLLTCAVVGKPAPVSPQRMPERFGSFEPGQLVRARTRSHGLHRRGSIPSGDSDRRFAAGSQTLVPALPIQFFDGFGRRPSLALQPARNALGRAHHSQHVFAGQLAQVLVAPTAA